MTHGEERFYTTSWDPILGFQFPLAAIRKGMDAISEFAKILMPNVQVQGIVSLQWSLRFRLQSTKWKPIFMEHRVSSRR